MSLRDHLRRVYSFAGRSQNPLRRPKKARRQLMLEGLEERMVPTVIYNPIFLAETPAGDSGHRLISAPVYLILWGSSWNGTNSSQAVAIEQAAGAVMSSPYLTGIQQYGSDGHAAFGKEGELGPFVWDVSDPANGKFGQGEVDDIIDNTVNQAFVTDPNPNAIYVVVTAPGVLSNVAGAGGFNFMGDYPSIWVGTTNNVDDFSNIFSHEIAEIMTEPDGSGFKVNPGASWTGGGSGNQIGDYEGNSYTFREPNGVLVQPYWSASDNAWIAPDGHAQNLFLNPIWTNGNFTGKFDLTINDDEQVGTVDDKITIGSKNGGIFVDQNGEQTLFDPGMIRTITINSSLGKDTINVESTLAGSFVFINLGFGNDTVNITPTSQDLNNLKANIQVSQGKGFDTLNVYDQADTVSDQYGITASVVAHGGIGGRITYSSIELLTIYGGKGSQSYNVGDTIGPSATTIINCGPDGSMVNVQGTTGNLTIVAASPSDVVVLSPLQNPGINGPVTIKNGPLAATIIVVDDSADAGAHTATLDTVVPAGEKLPFGVLTNLAPAPIQFQWSGTQAVHITTGMRDDTLNVRSTHCPVYLDNAGGTDTVNVGGAGSESPSGDVQRIHGLVSVSNSSYHGSTHLNVDDSGDGKSKTANITSGYISDLAPAYITYDGKRLASLTIRGGSGGNYFYVRGTPSGPNGVLGPNVTLFAGSIADTVYVGDDNNTLDGIQGPLTVNGQGGQDTLNVYDQGSNATHTYILTSTPTTSTIQRLGAAPITYDNTTEIVTVDGSNGVDTYTVQSPPRPSR